MNRLICIAIAFALTGCAGMSVQQRITAACATIAQSEQAAHVLHPGSFKDDPVVTSAVAFKAATCNHAPYPTAMDDATLGALEGVAAALATRYPVR